MLPQQGQLPRQFPKVLGLGTEPTVLGTRLAGIPREAPSLTHAPPFPVASRLGEYSRVEGKSSRAISLRY
jgi:hypothetical protein